VFSLGVVKKSNTKGWYGLVNLKIVILKCTILET
jgi:hypothetical protein